MKKEYLFNCLSRTASLLKAALVLFVFSLPLFTNAQPPDPIQGIVNVYKKVVEIVPSKACIIVEDASDLDLNTMVMIVQMKGATIDLNTTSSFGNIGSQNNAGNYEIGGICFIKDMPVNDSVFFFHNLMNTYTPSTGKVQLVQFAEYMSAQVVDTVKALPWDSAAGIGGVIAIYCNEDLILDAPIFADSSGFRGGVFLPHSGTCTPIVGTAFAYDASSSSAAHGAYKGEGISDVPANLDGGKGAPANGGGGGNNHNNSGAGGANLTAGGDGGGNSSTGPLNCNLSGNHGRAGKPLSSSSGTKIFLGGGAGAGHANNGSITTNYGGNGGGIIFLWANTISGTEKITSNGGHGGESAADGAGGGGAGGTIILNVSNYSGTISVSANGGNGGNSVNDASLVRCFGAGGGGSGGVIYFSGALPSVTRSVDPGVAGVESNRNPGCNPAIPGVNGVIGSFVSNYTFSRSMSSAGYCSFLLPVKVISFTAILVNKKVQLDWEVANPDLAKFYLVERMTAHSQWTTIATVSASDLQTHYSSIDNDPTPGSNIYRLRIIEKTNDESYSVQRQVLLPDPSALFTVRPNPATDKIIIDGHFEGGTKLFLSDVQGRVILERTVNTGRTILMLPELAPGIYLLRVNNRTQRLVIH